MTDRNLTPARGSGEIGPSGRVIYGKTAPGSAVPCSRSTPLSNAESREVVEILAQAHESRTGIELPERLRTRHWESLMTVVLELDARRGRRAAGWKIGAASDDIRRAEGVPSPAPGRIYADTVFSSPASLPAELFVNYRNNESEFAFHMERDLLPRETPYSEREVSEAIGSMHLAIEIGDSVLLDWYGASGYLGTSLDNGGGAAIVLGEPLDNWREVNLADTRMDIFLNGTRVKSGHGREAMGDPLTSLTWLVNWLSARGIALHSGEIVSTGTCTGHCFAASGDHVEVVFDGLGSVEVVYE